MKERDLTKNAEESEKAIESYLIRKVKEAGGMCLKYHNPNATGYPDRLILLPGIPDVWVEVKSKSRQPTALQTVRMENLRAMGRLVRVADSKKKVDEIMEQIFTIYSERKNVRKDRKK